MADRHKLFRFGSIGCLTVGTLLLIVGIIMISVLPVIVKKQVSSQVPLTPGGETTENWVKPPYDVLMEYWFFNVSNPDEVALKGAKPSLVQVGPYSYTEIQTKHLLNEMEDGDRKVTYRNIKTYHWNQQKSCPKCTQNDKITVPNVILMTIGRMVYSMKNQTALKTAFGLGLSMFNEFPFVTKPVRQLLFEGYEDGFVDFAKKIVPAGMLDLPDRVGFFYKKNNTDDGVYVVETGVGDVKNVGKIISWRNKTSLKPFNFWGDDWANSINGTDGTLYPPFLTRNDQPQLFVSDICRSMYIHYDSDISRESIAGYRYVVPADVFNSSLPQNYGFCVKEPALFYPSKQRARPERCLPSGLLDVSKCQPGNPPVVISSPHFLFTPDYVQDSMIGLHPNLQEHQTTIELEPTTGIGLRFERKLQINVAILNDPELIQLKYITNMIVPVVWLNESATITTTIANELWTKIVLSQKLVSGFAFTMIALGGMGVLSIAIMCVIFTYQQRKARKVYEGDMAREEDDSTSTTSSTAPISSFPIDVRRPNDSMDNPVYSTSNRTSRASSAAPSVDATPQIMRHPRTNANGPTGVIRFDHNGNESHVQQADEQK